MPEIKEENHRKNGMNPLRRRAINAERKLKEFKRDQRITDMRDGFRRYRTGLIKLGFPEILIEAGWRWNREERLTCVVGLTSGATFQGKMYLGNMKYEPHSFLSIEDIHFHNVSTQLADIPNWDIEIRASEIAWVAIPKTLREWHEQDLKGGDTLPPIHPKPQPKPTPEPPGVKSYPMLLFDQHKRVPPRIIWNAAEYWDLARQYADTWHEWLQRPATQQEISALSPQAPTPLPK